MKKKNPQPFDEETAARIIQKEGLSLTTLKVWRTRGAIPGEYFRDDNERDKTDKLHIRDASAQKVAELLTDARIAASKFRTLGQKGADVARRTDRLTEAELLGVKTEITEIRNKISQAIRLATNRNMYSALRDVRLHPTKIIDARIYSRLSKDALLEKRDIDTIKTALNALYNFLKL